jgi:hypothetical protein
MLVGLISDTHGLLRPEALEALRGSKLIVHAGDIGRPEVLDRLNGVAPTFAVRGNIDTQPWAAALPTTEAVEAGPHLIWVLHGYNRALLEAVVNALRRDEELQAARRDHPLKRRVEGLARVSHPARLAADIQGYRHGGAACSHRHARRPVRQVI